MEETDFLLLKSTENINSANLLITNGFAASSIHCSYYSCVQMMLHVLRSDLNKTEEELEILSEKGSRDYHGFHNWLQNVFCEELIRRDKDARIAFDFNTSIGNLKGIRIRSDYRVSGISNKEANKALILAKKINKLIEDKFKL